MNASTKKQQAEEILKLLIIRAENSGWQRFSGYLVHEDDQKKITEYTKQILDLIK